VRLFPLQKERRLNPAHRVLILDDNAVHRRMAPVVFQKLSWEAETVDSGERALLHLAPHRYDLVLLDISMPGMNGLDVCQPIRTHRALRGLRVIASTAHAFLEEQQRFLAGGFDDVLLKPMRVRAVQEMLLAQTPCPEPETPHSQSADHFGEEGWSSHVRTRPPRFPSGAFPFFRSTCETRGESDLKTQRS
jgi:CheY-like chemotaxis protein